MHWIHVVEHGRTQLHSQISTWEIDNSNIDQMAINGLRMSWMFNDRNEWLVSMLTYGEVTCCLASTRVMYFFHSNSMGSSCSSLTCSLPLAGRLLTDNYIILSHITQHSDHSFWIDNIQCTCKFMVDRFMVEWANSMWYAPK